jgi:hypothetical protein
MRYIPTLHLIHEIRQEYESRPDSKQIHPVMSLVFSRVITTTFVLERAG